MKKMFMIPYLGIGLWAATIAASVTITAHITRSVGSLPNLPTTLNSSPNDPSARPDDDRIAQVANAPYRDGLFQGKLARSRGNSAHVAVGRWANQNDRAAFTAGYQVGFDASTANAQGAPTEH